MKGSTKKIMNLILSLLKWGSAVFSVLALVPFSVKIRDEILGSEPTGSIPFTYWEWIVCILVGTWGFYLFGWIKLRMNGVAISFGEHLNSY